MSIAEQQQQQSSNGDHGDSNTPITNGHDDGNINIMVDSNNNHQQPEEVFLFTSESVGEGHPG